MSQIAKARILDLLFGWTNYLTSLFLSLLICKMRMIISQSTISYLFGPVAVRASLQSVTLEVHSALLCLSFHVIPWGLFRPTVSYLPGKKDSISSLPAPTPHTVATQWVFSAHVDGWRFKSLLFCLVCFFWVWNKIPEVRVGLESQKYPQMERFLIPLSSLLFDSGKMLDKIWELDEMKQCIRVPCHLGRWWLKMASLTLCGEGCLGRHSRWVCKGAWL